MINKVTKTEKVGEATEEDVKKYKQSLNNVKYFLSLEGAIFCVCRKPYEGENDMFEC